MYLVFSWFSILISFSWLDMICFFSCRFCLSKIGKLGHSHFQVQINNVDRLYHALFSLLHLLLAWSIHVLNIFFVPIFWSLVAARQFAGPAIVSFLSTTLPINHSTTLPLHPSIHPSIHPLSFQPQRLIHFAAAPGLPASHSAIVCILQKLRIFPWFSRTKSLKETSKPVPSDPVISKSPNPKPKLKNQSLKNQTEHSVSPRK